MGVSPKKCVGRCLLNHLRQKNVAVNIQINYNKTSAWNGTLNVYDTTFKVCGKNTKNAVVDELMEQAHELIWSKM